MEFEGLGFYLSAITCPATPASEGITAKPAYVEIEAYFLDVRCNTLLRLAFIESWLKSYLYNKIGSLKTNKTCCGDPDGDVIYFEKRQKDGEVFLYACVKRDGKIVREKTFDYQQVTMLEIAVSKALSCIRP